MRLTPDSVVVELLQKSPMRDTIKGLGEVENHKAHLPSQQRQRLSLAATLGSKIVSEYDQEIPQSQTADNPVAPRGRVAQPSRDTRKTN